jgi:hypothetical protein
MIGTRTAPRLLQRGSSQMPQARDTEPELRISTAVGILVVLLALVILFAAIAFLVTT